MKSIQRACSAAAILIWLGGSPVLADEVHDEIDAARSAYDGGDLRGAVQALQYAMTKIQEQLTSKLWGLLPDPLPGWQAEAPQAQGGGVLTAIAGTHVTRRYYNDEGGQINLSAMADSPMIGMMGMMLSSPYMMQSTPGTKAFSHDGYRGISEHVKGSSKWEMKLLVANRIYIELTGSGLEDEAPMQAYLEALDLKAIEKAMIE